MCFSSPKPPPVAAPSAPPPPAPLAPELPDATNAAMNNAAKARSALRIDLAPGIGSSGLNIPQ